MVLKHLDAVQGYDPRGDEQLGTSFTGQAVGDGFRSYEVADLSPDQPSTPTGMSDEFLLVAWLIVLLRAREDGQVRYDWAYKGPAAGFEEHEPVNTLSTDQVVSSLQSTIQQVLEAVSRHVTRAAPTESAAAAAAGPASLLLSTGPLSRASEGVRDEVSQQPIPSHLAQQGLS